MEIKNLKKVAQRIKKAIRQKERIILYGDADLDGITSVIILAESILNLGGKIQKFYFPNREKEGYGINEKALKRLKKEAPAIFVALDCGISNFKEINLAQNFGFEVIIIDHHEILDRLPEASIIVNPKQKGDKYPFKGLATVGIVFRLAQLLLARKLSESLKKSFLELVALATLADMMPQEKDNKIMIEEGLASLENSWRPGIKALMEINFGQDVFSLRQKVSKIISLLNIRDLKRGLPACFRLLTVKSSSEAKRIIDRLLEKNILRRERIKEIINQVQEKITLAKETPVIFRGESSWELSLLGTVASTISQKYQKPTFLFKKLKKQSLGTVRAPSGQDMVELMKKCQKYLITFGGHPQAAGFSIKNENLEKFKKCLLYHLRESK